MHDAEPWLLVNRKHLAELATRPMTPALRRARHNLLLNLSLDAKDQNLPEINGWHARTQALAHAVAGIRPDSLIAEVHLASGLPSLRERHAGGTTFLVVNPLWRTDGTFGAALSGSEQVRFIDTFNLERRPLRAIELASMDPVS